MDEEVGLRELRQNASDLVRRVQNGEHLVVTVSGRPAATLVPVEARRWRTWGEVSGLLMGTGAQRIAGDTDQIDHGIRDPFDRADETS